MQNRGEEGKVSDDRDVVNGLEQKGAERRTERS
jgi:hypothetical protein